MLACWHAEGPNGPNFLKHKERLWDYLWLAEDGMKMQVRRAGQRGGGRGLESQAGKEREFYFSFLFLNHEEELGHVFTRRVGTEEVLSSPVFGCLCRATTARSCGTPPSPARPSLVRIETPFFCFASFRLRLAFRLQVFEILLLPLDAWRMPRT